MRFNDLVLSLFRKVVLDSIPKFHKVFGSAFPKNLGIWGFKSQNYMDFWDYRSDFFGELTQRSSLDEGASGSKQKAQAVQ